MVRTQVQLTESQVEALRRLSASRNQSIAEIVRASVDRFVREETDDRRERAKSIVGMFASGSSDGSANHDHHLADAFSK